MDLRKPLCCIAAIAIGFTSHGVAAPATTLIAGTSIGPYRSTDGGATWKQIFFNSTDPAFKGQGSPKLNSLAVDPKNPSNLFAGCIIGSVTAFLGSVDGGQNWSLISLTPFGFKAGAGVLAIDPVMSNVIYASTPQQGIEVSTDGGVTWTEPVVPNPLPGRKEVTPNQGSIAALAVDPNRTGVIYVIGPDDASSNSGKGYVLTSSDYGRTWSVLAQGLDFSDRVFVDPTNSQILYASNTGSSVGNCTASNGGQCGLYKSTDGGKTWTVTSMPRGLVQSVAFDPTMNSMYAWAGGGLGNSGVFKSSDAAATWTPVLPNNGVGNFGKVVRVDRGVQARCTRLARRKRTMCRDRPMAALTGPPSSCPEAATRPAS